MSRCTEQRLMTKQAAASVSLHRTTTTPPLTPNTSVDAVTTAATVFSEDLLSLLLPPFQNNATFAMYL